MSTFATRFFAICLLPFFKLSYTLEIYCNSKNVCHVGCNTAQSCNNEVITIDNGDLHVSCTGLESCFNITVGCPSDGICNIVCYGESSCIKATINNWSNNDNFIACTGYKSCKYTNLALPPSTNPFRIMCNNQYACEQATIYCPETNDCQVFCMSANACDSATIHWSSDQSVISTLTCGAGACNNVNQPPSDAAPTEQPFTRKKPNPLLKFLSEYYYIAIIIVFLILIAAFIKCFAEHKKNRASDDKDTIELPSGKWVSGEFIPDQQEDNEDNENEDLNQDLDKSEDKNIENNANDDIDDLDDNDNVVLILKHNDDKDDNIDDKDDDIDQNKGTDRTSD